MLIIVLFLNKHAYKHIFVNVFYFIKQLQILLTLYIQIQKYIYIQTKKTDKMLSQLQSYLNRKVKSSNTLYFNYTVFSQNQQHFRCPGFLWSVDIIHWTKELSSLLSRTKLTLNSQLKALNSFSSSFRSSLSGSISFFNQSNETASSVLQVPVVAGKYFLTLLTGALVHVKQLINLIM